MIATIGEALVDLIEQADGHFRACLGGSVCNFTQGLAKQGVATTYLTPLSTDRFGQRFAVLLQESGVSLAASARSPLPTALAVVSLDEHGTPDYAFHREAVADRDISADQLIASFPEQLELLHTGGLALVPSDIGKTLAATQAAAGRGALVSIDANVRPIAVRQLDTYLDGVRQALRQAHIVKVSDEDLEHLGLGGQTLAEVARVLFQESATQLIAVTHGARGATLMTRSCVVAAPAPADLTMVDTVGAGDCFHAGLLAYLQRSGKLSYLAQLEPAVLMAALRHAIAAASLNIMRAGCDPASWDQTLQFQKAYLQG